jgi:hypothetical protein
MHCTYPRNPDTATNCVKCRALLTRRGSTLTEEEFTAQRGQTAVENLPLAGDGRRQTVAEGVSQASSYPPPISDPAPPRWNDSGASTPYSSGASSGAGVASPVAAGAVASGSSRSSAQNDQAMRRRTIYNPNAVEDFVAGSGVAAAAARPAPAPGAGVVRKIVGILITYSWEEQGQIFPVLEGRNLIGKDPSQCNICIPQDATLSDVNSSIAYRSQFVIRDKDSMSGTFVDGAFVEAEPIPLRNYAKIRTGSTNWTFVVIQPPSPAAPETAASDS